MHRQGFLGALLVGLVSGPAAAVTIDITGSTTASPGNVIEIPVVISIGPSEQVVATQNEIVFDPAVLTPASCRVSPDIGPGSPTDKPLSCSVASGGTGVRCILFAASPSQHPLPHGRYILYSCPFIVREDAPLGETLLRHGPNLIASDPAGKRNPVSGSGATIAVVGGTVPARGGTPRPKP